MPAKNSLKFYLENSYYHVYNRGAGKGNIFKEDQDYKTFLHFLEKRLNPRYDSSFDQRIKLLAYCLMPNHFHLFIFQTDKKDIEKFMRSLCTSYSMYFNKKYDRSGTLFQGRYKAVLIESEPFFLHLSRYIHLNPAKLGENWRKYPYSSYQNYLGTREHNWIDPKPVLNFFKSTKGNKHFSYKDFVESFQEDSENELGELALD